MAPSCSQAASLPADRHELADVEPDGEPSDRVVLGERLLAELGHLAEHRPGAARARALPMAASARSAARMDSGFAL